MKAEPSPLPHTGRARFVLRVLAPDRCLARVPADHALARDGFLPSAALVELGAQAAFALAATAAEAGGEEPPPGRVVAVRSARFERASLPAGVELTVTAAPLEAAPPLRTYRWCVEGYGEGVVSIWTD